MEIWDSIVDWFDSIKVAQQIKDVDYQGLVRNPWFMVPFCCWVAYMLFRQAFRDLIIIAIIIGVWWASGTQYMQTLVVGDELSMEKILPVVFGGAVALGVVIYLLFGRSK